MAKDKSLILSPEDKKYLSRTCRYMASMGMDFGTIEIDMDGTSVGSDVDAINWSWINKFSNNYYVDLPEGLIPILQKIYKHIVDSDLLESPDVESINWERLNFEINCEGQEIKAVHDYSYYDQADGQTIEYDEEDSEYVFSKLEDEEAEINFDDHLQLILRYNGSGDSGYIESNFENGDSVPASVEDWCYQKLENNFGGWEINEGSEGYFLFDGRDKTVKLNHVYNTEESESITLWEGNF